MYKIILLIVIGILFAQTVNALCWNPLELFCLFGEESMGSPIIPVEPEELPVITRTASQETSCIGNKCSATTNSFVQNSSGDYVYFTEMYDIKPNDDYSFSILKEGKEIDRINLTLKDDKGKIDTKSVSDIKINQILVKGKDSITFDWNITKPEKTDLKTIEMNIPQLKDKQIVLNFAGIENSYNTSKEKTGTKTILSISVNSSKTEFYLDPTAGPNSTGTVVDNSTVGTDSWSDPQNAKISDNIYAVIFGYGYGAVPYSYSHYLKANNFSFSIPSGSTINGINVSIEKKASEDTADNYVTDYVIKIIKADNSIGTTNKANTITHWSTTDTYISYGNSTYLWGETWTAENINDIDFGVVLQIYTHISSGPCLTKNSVIYTPNGYKNIADIKVGDEVFSFNEKTKKIEKDIVIGKREFIKEKGDIYYIYTNKSVIETTGNHNFYVEGRWAQADKLKVENILMGEKLEQQKIIKIEIKTKDEKVFDLTIKNNSNFFVNGILVHNTGFTYAYVDHIRITVYYTAGGETTPPTYASQAKNITTFLADSSIQFNATISDASNVNNWTFSWNATKGNTWNNVTNSSTGLAANSVIASANHSLVSKTVGDVFGYMFCSADALGNINCDALSTFTISASDTCTPTIGQIWVIEHNCTKSAWSFSNPDYPVNIKTGSLILNDNSNLTAKYINVSHHEYPAFNKSSNSRLNLTGI